jgi:PKD repeat protein
MRHLGKSFAYGFTLLVIIALLGSTMPAMATETTPTPTPAGWYDCAWNYRQSITIDRTKVAGPLSNFPVLVSLASDPDLASYARADGHDILFTSSDGTTRLSHEIESYQGSSGELVAWVKVPSLSPGSNTVLYMYYGNPAAANQQNGANVWSNGYRDVWHLDEGGTGARLDSTGSGNNLYPRNYKGIEGTPGQIGGADSLNGINKYLESANNVGITGSAARTITFWAKLANTNRCGMVGWGTNAYLNEFEAAVRANKYFLWGYGAGNDWENIASPPTGSWNYYTVTYDGATARWYLNGAQLGSGYAKTYTTADSHVYVGYEFDSGQSSITYMNGVVDEIHVLTASRSSRWIQTEFNNQNSPSTFSSLQAVEKVGDHSTCRIPTPPVAGFTADVTSGKAPLAVTFTDQSTNSPTGWSWDFGDSGTSTLQNPAHTYTAAGTYTVTLTASNEDGSNTVVKADYIAVTFDCGDSYRLVTPDGEIAGCVAFTNVWTDGEAANSPLDTLYAAYTMAEPFYLTSADVGVAFDSATVTPQYSQTFDASGRTKSYTFSIPLPASMDDVAYLYLTAHGVVQKEPSGTVAADMNVVVPENPIYYIIQG